MLQVGYKFIDSGMKCCLLEGQKTKFCFQTAWKMWHLRDIHLPNCHHPSAKVIVTQRDRSFNLLIFLDPEHRNASNSEHSTFTAKKSRYLNRREKARSNCQKFQRIQGSGESEIVQCWKSFKHLNKHSISWVSHPVSRSFNKLLLIWDRASLVITHGSHNPYSLKSLMFFGPLSWLAGIGPPLLQCVA